MPTPSRSVASCGGSGGRGRPSSTRTSSTPTCSASGGGARPRARPREHEARLQRVPPATGVRRDRPRRRQSRGGRRGHLAGLAAHLAEVEGFDEDAFEIVHYGIAAGPEPPPPPREPRLLAVGRLIPIKGLDTLLRAVAAARTEVPGLTLELAGSGPLEDELPGLAAALGLDDAVRFLGQRVADRAGLRARAGRGRPVARRGLRDGRAGGDGARAGSRRLARRRAAGARRPRRDGAARAAGRPRGAPGRARDGRVRSRAHGRDGRRRPPSCARGLPGGTTGRAARRDLPRRSRAQEPVDRRAPASTPSSGSHGTR